MLFCSILYDLDTIFILKWRKYTFWISTNIRVLQDTTKCSGKVLTYSIGAPQYVDIKNSLFRNQNKRSKAIFFCQNWFWKFPLKEKNTSILVYRVSALSSVTVLPDHFTACFGPKNKICQAPKQNNKSETFKTFQYYVLIFTNFSQTKSTYRLHIKKIIFFTKANI